MSGDWRPRVGCRLLATWPVDETPPTGWQRSDFALPLIWHIANGTSEDDAVELISYTESPDCGITRAPAKAPRVVTR